MDGVRAVDLGFCVRLCASCASSKCVPSRYDNYHVDILYLIHSDRLVKGSELIKTRNRTQKTTCYDVLELCYFEGGEQYRGCIFYVAHANCLCS